MMKELDIFVEIVERGDDDLIARFQGRMDDGQKIEFGLSEAALITRIENLKAKGIVPDASEAALAAMKAAKVWRRC